MRKYTIYIHFLLLTILFTLTGCNIVEMGHDETTSRDDDLIISNFRYDDDYKSFKIDIDSNKDLSDDQKLELFEVNNLGDTLSRRIAPRIVNAVNNKVEQVSSMGAEKVLVIVDMTLSEVKIEEQKEAVMRLLNAFNRDNFYISFMWNGSVSKSVLVTQYILDNHFKSHPSHKYLLRSILTKIDEMSGRQPRYFQDISKEELWNGISSEYKQLIVFSDGETYSDNRPIDNLHFQIQKQLTELPQEGKTPVVSYVNFGDATSNESERDLSIMLIVDRCGGEYYDSFNLNSLLSKLIGNEPIISNSGYELTLENPDGRLFMGGKHKLIINYIESDSLTYSGQGNFSIGSVYNPVIVRGVSIVQLISRGLFLSLLLVLIIYLILQFVVPYVGYWLFKRRYVSKYDGPESIVNGLVLNDTCYYCKEKFERGDVVVAKCQHTIHESCWAENGYRCPDYGSRCPDGSYYYNPKNLFDNANASIYMKWIICGCVAALLSWGCNLLFVQSYNDLPISLLSVVKSLFGESRANDIGGLVASEFLGLCLAFFGSIYISIFLSRGSWLRRRIWDIIPRVILVCVVHYLACALSLVIYIAIDVQNTLMIVDWIPWVLLSVGMVLILGYKKPIDIAFAMKGALITVALVVLTIYIWRLTDLTYFDTRMSQFLTCVIYCVGVSIALAAKLPTSNRYFLRVSGAIKDMDIAIYKWFSSPNSFEEVVVGKSVNSDICMSWDLSHEIAPSQFKLIRSKGNVYVVALDYGVHFIGTKSDLKIAEKRRLYHGEGFMVGRTKFIYVEIDV